MGTILIEWREFMNQDFRKLCNKIQNGEDLDIALPQYLNHLINIYGQYSNLNFSMLYYTFYEYFQEIDEISQEEDKILEGFNGLVKDFLNGEFNGTKMQTGLEELDNLRNLVINRMHILTSYTDLLEIYEYVLNRIEYRFTTEIVTKDQENEFISEVITHIFDTKDNVVINEKLKEVIGQLPVRITKAKYFDMLRDGLSIYKGGDYSSLETFLYMIRTSAMLYKVEGMDDVYPELVKAKEYFMALDYSNLLQEDFVVATKELENTVAWIREKVDFYFSIEECMNQLYVMILTHPYQFMDGYKIESLKGTMKFLLMPEEMDKFRMISRAINGYFLASDKPVIDEIIEGMITLTEGKQEQLIEEMEQMEAYFPQLSLNHKELIESLMLGPIYHSADMAGKLLSGSIFVDIKKETTNRVTSEADILREGTQLIEELHELFGCSQKAVIRAIMANTISKLPVFFKDSNEAAEYIKNSVTTCRDLAEKVACFHIIRTFIEN